MIILDIIHNLSILIALSILSGFILKRWHNSPINILLQGLLFGIVALIGMLHPFIFTEGIIFDGRSIAISLCTLFFGPSAGLISTIIALIYRVALGGGGALMGVSVIITSFIIGFIFYKYYQRHPDVSLSNFQLYVFGFLVHLVMLILMITLPGLSRTSALAQVGLTVIVFYPLATLLVGKILLDQENIFLTLLDLTESEERYSSIFNSSKAVMLLVNPQTGLIKDANKAACRYYGYSKMEITKKYVSDISTISKEKILSEFHKIRNDSKFYFIAKHRLASGEIRDVEIYVGELFLKGEPLLYSIIHDVTEKLKVERSLKESEDKLRLLVEGTPYLFFYTQGLDARITYISPSVKIITGRNVDEWMGQKHWFITDNSINEIAQKRTIANLKGEISNTAILVEVKHKNGNPIMLEVYENPIFRDGNVIGLQGVAHDITSRVNLMAELREAKEKAESANKLKTEFLAQMSHEIRSPLNAVLSYTSLLEEDYHDTENPDVKLIFTGIVSSGKRIIRTIDSILNMSQLQLGLFELNFEKINLELIIDSLILEYKSQSRMKNLELNKIVEIENSFLVADDYVVTQTIANLLDNAIKYTISGYVKLILSSDDDEIISLKIHDSGIGISEEYLPHLFEEFTQEDQGYSRRFEGNGLGLALVKKYCELLDAQINVESAKDKGSVFEIKFKKNRVNVKYH